MQTKLKQLFIAGREMIQLLLPRTKNEYLIISFCLLLYGTCCIYFINNVNPEYMYNPMGYDSYWYIKWGGQLHNVVNWNLRHPLLLFILSPITFIDQMIIHSSPIVHYGIFTILSSIIASWCVLLVYKISVYLSCNNFASMLCALLYACFGHMILLSISFESFIMTQFFLLLLIVLFINKRKDIYTDSVIFLLLTGTTITNILKLIVVYLYDERKLIKSIQRTIKSSVLFVIVILPLALRNVFKGNNLLGDTTSYIQQVPDRLYAFYHNFISEPLLLHGMNRTVYPQINNIYHSEIGHYFFDTYPCPLVFNLSIIIIVFLTIISFINNRRNEIIQIFFVWFLIDIVILFGSGYGLCQAEIFCGHWFFIIPILISCSFSLFKHKIKYVFYFIICSLSLFFLVYNTSMIINSLNSI